MIFEHLNKLQHSVTIILILNVYSYCYLKSESFLFIWMRASKIKVSGLTVFYIYNYTSSAC